MSELQVYCVIGSFLLVGLMMLLATKQWIPSGIASAIVYGLLGIGVTGLLWYADMPPHWFDGGSWGFILAVSLVAWGFVAKSAAERAYRLPFLLGMGGALLAANVWAHV